MYTFFSWCSKSFNKLPCFSTLNNPKYINNHKYINNCLCSVKSETLIGAEKKYFENNIKHILCPVDFPYIFGHNLNRGGRSHRNVDILQVVPVFRATFWLLFSVLESYSWDIIVMSNYRWLWIFSFGNVSTNTFSECVIELVCK